jgi:hypothetical protein
MTENKNFENERYLYGYAHVYTPDSFEKPKLHEMGYFTDNMNAFDNLKDSELCYVYGELTDYNDDCERRYYCDGAEYVDAWLDEVSLDGNYAFYIPESSIPQEKREWYRRHAINLWRYEND